MPPREQRERVRRARAARLDRQVIAIPGEVRRELADRGIATVLLLGERLEHHDFEVLGKVRREGARLLGENTDAQGLVRSLIEAGVEPGAGPAVVLGAGGAARTAVVGLAEAGVPSITIAARRETAAHALASELSGAVESARLDGRELSESALRSAFADASLLVQATSATLRGAPEAQVFADALPLAALPDEAAVVDLVYAPLRTTVLAAADARGLRTVPGLGMLIWQAALAFSSWTGHEPPVDAMRAGAEGALAASSLEPDPEP